MIETLNFLFVIDVSGSMYGQKIATVNASLTECLAELQQIGLIGHYEINVSIVTFADAMQEMVLNKSPENISLPNIEVSPQADGFYLSTSFSCLYNGLKELFDSGKIEDGKQGENTYIFLISDAKPVDEKQYLTYFDTIQHCKEFKNARKYVGFAEEGTDKFNKNTVKFVDYRAERIVRVSELPGEIVKIQISLLSDYFDESNEYDNIFV